MVKFDIKSTEHASKMCCLVVGEQNAKVGNSKVENAVSLYGPISRNEARKHFTVVGFNDFFIANSVFKLPKWSPKPHW